MTTPNQPGYGQYPAQPPAQPGFTPPGYPQPGAAAYPPAPPQHAYAPQLSGQGITLTTKFFPMAWLFFFIKPKVLINGHEVPTAKWGRNEIALPAGQYHLHVHVPYFLPPKIGPADLNVTVAPGTPVELEYRAPLWNFSPGSLGAPPQSYNGLGLMIGVTAVAVVLIFLIALLPLLAV